MMNGAGRDRAEAANRSIVNLDEQRGRERSRSRRRDSRGRGRRRDRYDSRGRR